MLVLDFDGTLLDSSSRHVRVLQDVLSDAKVDIEIDSFLEFKANGKNTFEYLKFKGLNDQLSRSLSREWIARIEDETYLKIDFLYDDVLDFLAKAKLFFKLSLLTARKNKSGTLTQISRLGISSFFERIDIVEPGSRAVEMKSEILSNVDAISMVGDSEVDLNASLISNVPFYALNRGFRSQRFWKELNVSSNNKLVFEEFKKWLEY